MMLRIAERVARREHALGLITGDSVAQVASQTLHNLHAVDRAATLPVYRPLIGEDKLEILQVAAAPGQLRHLLRAVPGLLPAVPAARSGLARPPRRTGPRRSHAGCAQL